MKRYVWIGNSLLILFFILFLSFIAFVPRAQAVDWTHEQKLRLGLIDKKTMVTCRLAKRKVIRDQKICIYLGANNTTDTIFIDKWEYCPRQIQCVYEPEKDTPNILEMMESLEKSLKKR